MLKVKFDVEQLRKIIREEVREAVRESVKAQDIPPLLTVKELKALLNIGSSKATELMGRPDFPVMREAGVLVPTHLLFKWIERHTQWLEDNTSFNNIDWANKDIRN